MATETQIRAKVVATAKKYLGAKRGSAKHKKIIKIFNKVKPDGWAMTYTAAWCAAFASAIEIEALGKANAKKICPLSANCESIIARAKRKGCWIEKDSHKPKKGDWILYDWQDSGRGDNKGTPDHVGIVEKIGGGVVTVIEGNKGTASEVGRRALSINGRFIRGYVAIPYGKLATKAAPAKKKAKKAKIKKKKYTGSWPTIPAKGYIGQGDKGPNVLKVQKFLRWYDYKIAVDGAFGPKTRTAVVAFQKAKKLDPDGRWGKKTQAAAKKVKK